MNGFDETELRSLANEIDTLKEEDLDSAESDLLHQETALEEFLEQLEQWRENVMNSGHLPLLPAGMFGSGFETKIRDAGRGFRNVASATDDEFSVAEQKVKQLLDQTRAVLQKAQKRLGSM